MEQFPCRHYMSSLHHSFRICWLWDHPWLNKRRECPFISRRLKKPHLLSFLFEGEHVLDRSVLRTLIFSCNLILFNEMRLFVFSRLTLFTRKSNWIAICNRFYSDDRFAYQEIVTAVASVVYHIVRRRVVGSKKGMSRLEQLWGKRRKQADKTVVVRNGPMT